MKIEIKTTKENGVIQITTLDERWYAKEIEVSENGRKIKKTVFNPSITWIAHYAPMGLGLLKFYANKGWDEAESVKRDAAEHGTKTHQACEVLLHGGQITLDSEFKDNDNEKVEPLTPNEYWNVMTFENWWKTFSAEHVVEVMDTEKTAWVDAAPGEQYGYAGTRDMKLKVDGRPTIIDLKTSQDVYLSHEMQLSALKHADRDNPDIFVLQIGYKRNKNGWKLTPIEDKFPLFLSAKKFWQDANPESKPKQKDFPPVIKLTFAPPQTEKLTAAKHANPAAKSFPTTHKKPAKGTRSKVDKKTTKAA